MDSQQQDSFDPTDSTDAMSEMFRLQVTNMALDAYKITLYRELDTAQQFECFLAGALTGLVGVCLASAPTSAADDVMKAISDTLPAARKFAEEISGNALNAKERK